MLQAEFEGEKAPELVTSKTVLELSGQDYRVRYGGEAHDRGTFVIAEGSGYSLITLQGREGTNAGRTIPAIYQCVRDRLRVCYGFDGVRPTSFTTSVGSQRYLATYKRIVG